MQVEVALRSPTAGVVVFAQTQLIEPHLATLLRARVVAHTNHHRLYLAERRVTHHRNLVLRLVRIVCREQAVVRCLSVGLRLVAFLLEVGQLLEVDVQHVLLGPNLSCFGCGVAVILARRCELQRNLVLIEVALIVRTETYEYGELSVFQSGGVLLEGVGMHEHLQTLILTDVQRGVLIYRLCLARTERCDGHGKRLLVVLHELRLRRVLSALDARRQNVVDGLLVSVLFYVDSRNSQSS